MRVTVKDKVVESVAVLETGERLPLNRLKDYHSIESLFSYLQRAIERNPEAITITYNARGYPSEASIDYRSNVSDDEISLTAKDLVLSK